MSLGNRRCCINKVNNNEGPQGAIGAYGPIGEIGITGSTGSTGPDGSTGLCYRGYKGPQGSIGPQGGTTGPTGPIGEIGSSGIQQSLNLTFTFSTIPLASYDAIGFTDLTSFATTPISNALLLSIGKYAIKFEIYENWTDTDSKFYVRLNDGSSYIYSYVFKPLTSSYLALNNSSTNLYGIGNDTVTITNFGLHTIELLQSTNSSSPILIPNKTVNFSITFVKIA